MKNILFISALIIIHLNACKPSGTLSNNNNSKNANASYSIDAFPKLKALVSNDTIYTQFANASFDKNLADYSKVPKHWTNCGTPYESPPDLHSSSSKLFQVKQSPQHGKRYIGLVARDSGTKEKLSQKLERTLMKGERYSFSLYASRSKQYISLSRSTMKEENFNEPARLLIWLSNSHCNKKIRIIETKIIEHTNWREYNFSFTPAYNADHLMIEIDFSHKKNNNKSYNGNVLIDNISPVYKISR